MLKHNNTALICTPLAVHISLPYLQRLALAHYITKINDDGYLSTDICSRLKIRVKIRVGTSYAWGDDGVGRQDYI